MIYLNLSEGCSIFFSLILSIVSAYCALLVKQKADVKGMSTCKTTKLLLKIWINNSPHQTIQLGHRALAARLADVPDFDTPFATSVDMTCGVANGNGAHHLTMAQRVDLTGVAWNPRTDQGIRWEGHGLHLTISADMEGVRPDGKNRQVLLLYTKVVFQIPKIPPQYLRFATRDGREAGWKAWCSHMSVRVKSLKIYRIMWDFGKYMYLLCLSELADMRAVLTF